MGDSGGSISSTETKQAVNVVNPLTPMAGGSDEMSSTGSQDQTAMQSWDGGEKSWDGGGEEQAKADRPRTAADVRALQSLVTESLFGAKMPEVQIDGELSDHELRQVAGGLFHPKAKMCIYYNLMQATILLYFMYTVPKWIAFVPGKRGPELEVWEATVDVVIQFLLFVDIGVNFFQYFYDKNGILVTDSKAIQKKYLRSWFPVDVISVMPIDQILKLVGFIIGNRDVVEAATVTRMVKLIRFSRMFKLPKQLDLEQMQLTLSYILRPLGISLALIEFLFTIMFLTGMLFGLTHIFACLWASQGFNELDKGQGWMQTYYIDGAAGILPSSDQIYTDSFYYATVTISTVGYGDYSPQTAHEKRIAVMLIVIGAFIYAFIIGSFGAMIDSLTKDKSEFDTKMRGIHKMLQNFEVDRSLVDRCVTFYNFKFDDKKLYDGTSIMAELPTAIRQELLLHRYQSTIDMLPFLAGIRPDITVDICTQFQTYPVMPTDFVMKKGDYGHELLILVRGVARSVPDTEAGETSSQEYEMGSFFGELNFLSVRETREMSVQARVYCEVAALNPDHIDHLLTKFPFLRKRLATYAELRQQIDTMIEDNASFDAIKSSVAASAAALKGIEEDDSERDAAARADAEDSGPSPRAGDASPGGAPAAQRLLVDMDERIVAIEGKLDMLVKHLMPDSVSM